MNMKQVNNTLTSLFGHVNWVNYALVWPPNCFEGYGTETQDAQQLSKYTKKPRKTHTHTQYNILNVVHILENYRSVKGICS